MPTISIDADFTANFNCYRHGPGYSAKGVIHFRGKPRRVFEVHGATISAAEAAARTKSEEICRELKRASTPKRKRPVK